MDALNPEMSVAPGSPTRIGTAILWSDGEALSIGESDVAVFNGSQPLQPAATTTSHRVVYVRRGLANYRHSDRQLPQRGPIAFGFTWNASGTAHLHA